MSKYGGMARTGFGEDSKGGEKSAVEQGLGVVATVVKAKAVGSVINRIAKGPGF